MRLFHTLYVFCLRNFLFSPSSAVGPLLHFCYLESKLENILSAQQQQKTLMEGKVIDARWKTQSGVGVDKAHKTQCQDGSKREK